MVAVSLKKIERINTVVINSTSDTIESFKEVFRGNVPGHRTAGVIDIGHYEHIFVGKARGESVRQFAQYLKAGGKTLPGGELNDLVPDKKQLREILSYERLR